MNPELKIIVGGETVYYSFKNQTDEKGVTRKYYRTKLTVSIDVKTGKKTKKEISAPNLSVLREKILAIQHTRSLEVGSEISFQQYMEGWMERNKNRIKLTTFTSYQYNLKRYVFPCIGMTTVAELDEDVFNDFFNMIMDKYSLDVARSIKFMLGCPMKEASEKHLTYGNPIAHIKLPKRQTKAVIPLSKEEVVRLIELCKNDSYGGPIAIALLLGLRISEAIGLGIDAIDIPHRLVHIRRQINNMDNKYILQNTTKNSTERVLYLDDLCIEFIERELKRQEHCKMIAGERWNNEYGCLFTTSKGRHLTHKTLREHLYKLTSQIGRTDFKFHHLRHTAATIVHEETRDINAVRSLLGHISYDSTEIYVHTSFEKLKQAAIAISNYCKA